MSLMNRSVQVKDPFQIDIKKYILDYEKDNINNKKGQN